LHGLLAPDTVDARAVVDKVDWLFAIIEAER
jgi:hypothetical protein